MSSSPIKVGVFGAGGRMGATVCDAVADDPALQLVAAVDPAAVGRTMHGVSIAADPRAMADAGVEVAVDFTVAAASRTNLSWCALHGVHAVVGTTGFSDDDLANFRSAFTSSNCLIAANFAISAVLMMKFAEIAAPWFDTAEIVELHHDNKADAPSGTAMATARRMRRRRVNGRPTRPRTRSSKARVAVKDRPTSACTPFVCAAWSPIRK